MSFILEALKKSERQRQQQGATPPPVRKRTLSLTANRNGRRWSLLVFAVSLIIVGLAGWWLITPRPAVEVLSSTAPSTAPAVADSPPVAASVAKDKATQSPAVTEPSMKVTPAAAPVPRPYAVAEQQDPLSTETGDRTIVATTKVSPVEPRAVTAETAQSAQSDYPLYAELSRELRNRMPPLEMTMHFFTEAPERRLVRINNHLMHEGDPIDADLEVVEITSSGVLIDYLGKIFELRNQR